MLCFYLLLFALFELLHIESVREMRRKIIDNELRKYFFDNKTFNHQTKRCKRNPKA